MLATQTKFMALCDELASIAKSNGLPEAFGESAQALKTEIERRELVTPVIGAFSAGKSALINNCLQRDILPEAVTPETSIATELLFSQDEYIEAVEKGGKVTRYSVDEMETLKENAARFQYARLFLNNPALREIAPLVLVDMPGFDSPLDDHNKAILAYLSRGAHYIVLSSGAEERTPSASLLRRLREIETLERGFSFYVSKTNLLASQADVDSVTAHYKTVLERELKHDVYVAPLGDNSGGEVIALLKSIDTDALIASLYRRSMKSLCEELVETLDLRIAANEKSAGQNRELVNEMEKSVAKVEKKAADMVADIEERYSNVAVNDIVKDVGIALDESIEELIACGAGGKPERVGQTLNEIVRTTLTSSVKSKLGRLASEISVDLSGELSSLGLIMEGYGSEDKNYAERFAKKAQSILEDSGGLDDADAKENAVKKTGGKSLNYAYKAVTTVIGLLSGGVLTLMEALVVFLPEILGPIFGMINRKIQEKELRRKLQTETFPSIKRKIQTELPKIMNEAVKGMIAEVRSQYTASIESQRATVTASIEKANNNDKERAKEREVLVAARDSATEIIRRIEE